MKFYEIKPGTIVNLFIIRTVQVLNKEIYLTYTCGDTKSERLIFSSELDALNAYKALCLTLGMGVEVW